MHVWVHILVTWWGVGVGRWKVRLLVDWLTGGWADISIREFLGWWGGERMGVPVMTLLPSASHLLFIAWPLTMAGPYKRFSFISWLSVKL